MKLPNKLQMANDIKQLKNRIKELEKQIYYLKAENKKLKETKENE